MYWYYKISYGSGSEKLVKSNSESCEIYQKSPFGNKYLKVDKPYPIFEEPEYTQLSEDEFIRCIGNIDFEPIIVAKPPINHEHY